MQRRVHQLLLGRIPCAPRMAAARSLVEGRVFPVRLHLGAQRDSGSGFEGKGHFCEVEVWVELTYCHPRRELLALAHHSLHIAHGHGAGSPVDYDGEADSSLMKNARVEISDSVKTNH